MSVRDLLMHPYAPAAIPVALAAVCLVLWLVVRRQERQASALTAASGQTAVQVEPVAASNFIPTAEAITVPAPPAREFTRGEFVYHVLDGRRMLVLGYDGEDGSVVCSRGSVKSDTYFDELELTRTPPVGIEAAS